jgi:hypothetical protein
MYPQPYVRASNQLTTFRLQVDAVEPRKQSQQDVAGGFKPIDATKQPYYADEKGNGYEHSDDDADAPTGEERQTLRKVSDKLPWSAFLVALVELCERFAYYGMIGPIQVG